MRLKDYIKIIYEARKPSQNVQAAMGLSDDDLVKYLKSEFPNISTIISKQPGLYQYLNKNRKEVLNRLKSKKTRGFEYYENIVSQFETLADLKRAHPSLYSYVYLRFGKEKATELFSRLKRSPRGRKKSEKTQSIPKTKKLEVQVKNLDDILKKYSSYDEFFSKNTQILGNMAMNLGSEKFAEMLSDIQKKFDELQIPEKESPTGVTRKEKFSLLKARNFLENTNMSVSKMGATKFGQGMRKYYGTNGLYNSFLKNPNIKNEKLKDPKLKLPLPELKAIATSEGSLENFEKNQPEKFLLAQRIYGLNGLTNLISTFLGIEPQVKKEKPKKEKVLDVPPSIVSGKQFVITNKQLRDFLKKYTTKEELRKAEPEVYRTLNRFGIVQSWFG